MLVVVGVVIALAPGVAPLLSIFWETADQLLLVLVKGRGRPLTGRLYLLIVEDLLRFATVALRDYYNPS